MKNQRALAAPAQAGDTWRNERIRRLLKKAITRKQIRRVEWLQTSHQNAYAFTTNSLPDGGAGADEPGAAAV